MLPNRPTSLWPYLHLQGVLLAPAKFVTFAIINWHLDVACGASLSMESIKTDFVKWPHNSPAFDGEIFGKRERGDPSINH